MKHTLISRLIVMATLGVCAEIRTAAAIDVYDGSFTCNSGPLSLHLPATYAGLLALGKIVRIADGKVQDYGTYKVIYRSIAFDGLTITAYAFSNDPKRYLLASVVVSDPSWKVAPLRVGQSAQFSLQHKGWPSPPVDGTWELAGDAASVSLAIMGGRITKLTYSCDAE